ncbi:MAG TPA: DUF2950 domain-containing protein [Bryobacteraceae bacterium]|jgi:hypothetical protein
MRRSILIALGAAGALLAGLSIQAAKFDGQAFATPDAAARALVNAAKAGDADAVLKILGPAAKDILVTNDPVADRLARRKFIARATERMKVIADPNDPSEKTMVVGKDDWPLPIPIVHADGKWYFDVEQGKDEILTRRIGSNELDAIEVSRGYVEAQNEYFATEKPGGVGQYAQRIISSPGKHDGLYWPNTGTEEASPIGDMIAKAFAEGYTKKGEPYHGYYFKVLTAQGPNAPGGAMNYIDNGAMTKGYALIAWPSDYGSTGVMTFLVSRVGIVYQKDLGPNTAAIAGAYTAYDPDKTWTPVTLSLGQQPAKLGARR